MAIKWVSALEPSEAERVLSSLIRIDFVDAPTKY